MFKKFILLLAIFILPTLVIAQPTLPFRCQPLAAAPVTCAAATAGRCYTDNTTTPNNVYFCDGTNWSISVISGGLPAKTVTDIASPNQNGGFKISTSWIPTTTATGLVYSVYGINTFTGTTDVTGVGHMVGVLGHSVMTGPNRTAALMVGTEGKFDNAATNTITSGVPLLASFTTQSGTCTTCSGVAASVTAWSGTGSNLWMHDVSITSFAGSVTNFAGFHMPDLSSFGGLTNRFTLLTTDPSAPIYMNGAQIFGAATNVWQFGAPNSASPANQTLQASGARGGTDTNVAGASVLVEPGAGTGNAAGTQYAIGRNLMGATGTTAQTQSKGYVICESKTLSNTSAQTTALASLGTSSNSSGSLTVWLSVQCNDGTNFDSDSVSCNSSWVNKAGTITFSTATCTSNSAVNNSGSCTIGATITASGNTVNINVTPVIGTIVPTTTTGYIELVNRSSATVTCN